MSGRSAVLPPAFLYETRSWTVRFLIATGKVLVPKFA
jgi:hypothetical protein